MTSFTKLFAAAALAVGSLTTSAFAGTITFGSYTGANTQGYANGLVTSPNNTVVASTTNYNNAFSGTQYVTYQNGAAPLGTTAYFSMLTGDLTGLSGSISVYADDLLTVKLNGNTLGTTSGPYTQMYTFGIPTADFLASGNILEFDVTNVGNGINPTAFDFKGTASTPEPSSLVLLGSGLVSAAGMVIRKRRVKA